MIVFDNLVRDMCSPLEEELSPASVQLVDTGLQRGAFERTIRVELRLYKHATLTLTKLELQAPTADVVRHVEHKFRALGDEWRPFVDAAVTAWGTP